MQNGKNYDTRHDEAYAYLHRRGLGETVCWCWRRVQGTVRTSFAPTAPNAAHYLARRKREDWPGISRHMRRALKNH